MAYQFNPFTGALDLVGGEVAPSGSAEQVFEIIDIAGGNTATGENGNWRFYVENGNLYFQKRVSGAWVTSDLSSV